MNQISSASLNGSADFFDDMRLRDATSRTPNDVRSCIIRNGIGRFYTWEINVLHVLLCASIKVSGTMTNSEGNAD